MLIVFGSAAIKFSYDVLSDPCYKTKVWSTIALFFLIFSIPVTSFTSAMLTT
jgi:hypothetical protein